MSCVTVFYTEDDCHSAAVSYYDVQPTVLNATQGEDRVFEPPEHTTSSTYSSTVNMQGLVDPDRRQHQYNSRGCPECSLVGGDTVSTKQHLIRRTSVLQDKKIGGSLKPNNCFFGGAPNRSQIASLGFKELTGRRGGAHLRRTQDPPIKRARDASGSRFSLSGVTNVRRSGPAFLCSRGVLRL